MYTHIVIMWVFLVVYYLNIYYNNMCKVNGKEIMEMTLKDEIKNAANEYVFNIHDVEIATLKLGLLAVWINGKRFGNYDIDKHEFVALMV